MRPITLELELPGEVTAAADTESRTIEGVAVPYGEIGVAAMGGMPERLTFARGALQPARDRVPLVLSHNVDAPVGVLTELRDTDAGAVARFAIDATPDGDVALVQAASGSRAGLSVGVVATEYAEHRDADGDYLEITSAELYHVGLVSIPAFASADVTRVAAARIHPTNEGGTVETTEQTITETVEAAAPITPATPAAEVVAERPVILATREQRAGELVCTTGELVQNMIRAANGDTDAQRVVTAALSQVASTDVPGLMPPQYVGSVLGEVTIERALADRVAVRRPMPANGMEFTKPKWTTLPNGGWVAENTAIPSNKPAIGSQDVSILEWAYGVALSYAVATRSTPDALESIYRAAVQDYFADCEQKLADLLLASDTPTAAGGTLGGAIAQHYASTNKTAPRPNLLVVAPDVYGDLYDELVMVPAMQGASGVGPNMAGTIGGLEVVVSPFLPDGTEIVTSRGVIEFRETSPVRLTANAIGALQVELGVTSFASFDLEVPGGIITLTPPAGAPAGTSQAKRSQRKAGKQ